MAREKSTTFQGTAQRDVDIDAATLGRVVQRAQADAALAHDRLTGLNGEVNTTNHDGSDGRGARLGVPYLNQYVGALIYNEGSVTAKDGGGDNMFLFACPLFVPAGETEIVVEVCATRAFSFGYVAAHAYMRRASDFAVQGDDWVPFDVVNDNGFGQDESFYRARITGLTPSTLCIFCIQINTALLAFYEESFQFVAVSVHPGRKRNRLISAPPGRGDSGNPIPVTTPSSTQPIAFVDMDSDLFAGPLAPINGYLTTTVNRNLNGLEEFVRGWPSSQNEDFTHVDHNGFGTVDDDNPARSRFHACTRSPYGGTPALPDEPEVDFPLWCEGFGAMRLDGGLVVNAPAIGTAPTSGMLEWFAPWPTDAASLRTIRSCPIRFPDFSSTLATAAKNTSALKWAVFVGFDSGTPADWSITVSTVDAVVGGVIGTSTAAVAAIAGSPGGNFGIAQGSGLLFSGDEMQFVTVGARKTVGVQAAVDEMVILGVCLWFEP